MDTMYTYNKVKNLCTAHGTNIFNLERAVGISASTIQRWKTNSPSSETLLKVAEYFNVSVDYLLGHKVGKSGDDIEQAINLPEDIVKDLYKLNSEGLDVVRNLLSGLTIQPKFKK